MAMATAQCPYNCLCDSKVADWCTACNRTITDADYKAGTFWKYEALEGACERTTCSSEYGSLCQTCNETTCQTCVPAVDGTVNYLDGTVCVSKCCQSFGTCCTDCNTTSCTGISTAEDGTYNVLANGTCTTSSCSIFGNACEECNATACTTCHKTSAPGFYNYLDGVMCLTAPCLVFGQGCAFCDAETGCQQCLPEALGTYNWVEVNTLDNQGFCIGGVCSIYGDCKNCSETQCFECLPALPGTYNFIDEIEGSCTTGLCSEFGNECALCNRTGCLECMKSGVAGTFNELDCGICVTHQCSESFGADCVACCLDGCCSGGCTACGPAAEGTYNYVCPETGMCVTVACGSAFGAQCATCSKDGGCETCLNGTPGTYVTKSDCNVCEVKPCDPKWGDCALCTEEKCTLCQTAPAGSFIEINAAGKCVTKPCGVWGNECGVCDSKGCSECREPANKCEDCEGTGTYNILCGTPQECHTFQCSDLSRDCLECHYDSVTEQGVCTKCGPGAPGTSVKLVDGFCLVKKCTDFGNECESCSQVACTKCLKAEDGLYNVNIDGQCQTAPCSPQFGCTCETCDANQCFTCKEAVRGTYNHVCPATLKCITSHCDPHFGQCAECTQNGCSCCKGDDCYISPQTGRCICPDDHHHCSSDHSEC